MIVRSSLPIALVVALFASPLSAQDDFPDGDADMPSGDEDEVDEEPPPEPKKPEPKKPEPKAEPKKPDQKPAGDVDDDILIPADEEELKGSKPKPVDPPPPTRVEREPDRGSRRLIVDEEEEVQLAPTRRRSRVTDDEGAPRASSTPRDRKGAPLATEETKRLDPEEPEPSAYDPMMLGVIAGGAGVGAVVVAGVVIAALVVTGPLVLGLWELPIGPPPTETGSITVTPK